MGSNFSRKGNSDVLENEEPSYFVAMNIDFRIMQDLLVDILSNLSPEDLIHSCRLVCKEWKELIDGHSIWKEKCERHDKKIPAVNLKVLPVHFYREIYIFNPYGRNLLRNPCGEDGVLHWIIEDNGGDGFLTEDPPNGSDAIPASVGTSSCFATSYSSCSKYQLIDLSEEKVHDDIIDLKSTKITIGEWHAARFDCASHYKLNVLLLDRHFSEMNPNYQEHIVDEFQFEFREEQWVGKEWHFISHTFENVGRTRFVFFQHFGQDCQFWAGHYGSKMTGAFVKVLA